jgi:hypothetical protein
MSPATLVFLGSTLFLPSPTTTAADAATATPATSLAAAAPDAADSTVASAVGVAEPGAQAGRRAGSSTQITWRGDAGLFFVGGDTGFLLGAGGGAYPFNNTQVEVTGDLHYARIAGANGVYGSGNGLYHFKTSSTQVQPYAGAGLGFDHFENNTDVDLQIAGGLEFNQRGKYPMRGEVRFFFTPSDTTTILMLGVKLK